MIRHSILFTAALLFGQLFFYQPLATDPNTPAETHVYICTGKSSKRYHNSEKCKGLDNCQANIKKVTLSYAEDTLKRTPCKLCYKSK